MYEEKLGWGFTKAKKQTSCPEESQFPPSSAAGSTCVRTLILCFWGRYGDTFPQLLSSEPFSCLYLPWWVVGGEMKSVNAQGSAAL